MPEQAKNIHAVCPWETEKTEEEEEEDSDEAGEEITALLYLKQSDFGDAVWEPCEISWPSLCISTLCDPIPAAVVYKKADNYDDSKIGGSRGSGKGRWAERHFLPFPFYSTSFFRHRYSFVSSLLPFLSVLLRISSRNVITLVKARRVRMRWTEHVACMGVMTFLSEAWRKSVVHRTPFSPTRTRFKTLPVSLLGCIGTGLAGIPWGWSLQSVVCMVSFQCFKKMLVW